MSDVNTNGDPSNDEKTIEEIKAELVAAKAAEKAAIETKDRILEEAKKTKEGLQLYKSKEEEAALAIKKSEEEKLLKDGQYKVLLEQRDSKVQELEKQLEEAEGRTKSLNTSIDNFKKASAFEREIGGKMKNQNYWDHVPFDKIATNPETGAIDKDSLMKVAGDFIKEHKELVEFGSGANLPNSNNGGNTGKKITEAQWKALPLADRKKRMGDVIRK